jgi:hypothetical protein
LNSHLAQLLIRTPPLQACKSQGLRDFHRFSELPLEIREIIWIFSLSGACSIRIRVHPLVPKDGRLLILFDRNKYRMDHIKFFYKDNNPIAVLRTSSKSRKAALSVYQYYIENGIYFCSDRNTLLFTGLEEMFRILLSTGARPYYIIQVLTNTFDYKANQLAD